MAKEKIQQVETAEYQQEDIETVVPAQKKKQRTHTVVKGDTLLSIAGKYLGSTARYTEIRNINNLPNDIIFVGQILIIPER